jgi:MFS family permease
MDTRKNVILILASVGTFVEALDIAIINLTIPSIQEQFHIGAGTVQWLQTLYVLLAESFPISWEERKCFCWELSSLC